MPALFRLRTFGSPLLWAADGQPVRFRTRKHLALLIRLATEVNRPLTRDYLIDLLWRDAPGPRGRHSLAQAISVLRTKLGRSQVLIHKSTVALDSVIDADVAHLDDCAAEICGAFLEGFEIPRARGFEEWIDGMRGRLLPRMRDCLVRHMDASRRIGDFATVERHAQVLLDLDPHSEDAVRGLMEARAWVGDRSNALKAYARFAARLEEELGAKPSAPLARVANLLREGRPVVSTGQPEPKPEKPFRAEHLVGREREFSVLYDAWLAVRRREPRIMLLTGDPGVGKTTLTNAFAATCQMEGAVVARAQAYDAERELPFAVLAELVRQLTQQRAIGSADPEALSELTRVCGEIYAAFPGVAKPAEWGAEVTPLRLAQAFWQTVEAAAEESPLLLVVDDIHAADSASAAILHVLARKLTPVRLLIVLTGRSSELRAAPAPAALVTDATIAALQTLEVEPLPPAAARRLLHELVPGTTAPLTLGATERILRASSGNPLALALLAREWQADASASLLDDLDRLNTQPAAAVAIPRTIGTMFERQRQRLPAPEAAALDLAAVLGRRLADLGLYEIAGLPPAAAAAALAQLRRDGMLREVQGALEFRNELIRAQAYYAVPATPRRHLHQRVAELLSARTLPDEEPPWLETAWHFLRGGDDVRGREYGMRGAEAALAVGAPHEAEQMLEVLENIVVDRLLRRRARLLLANALAQQSKADRVMWVIQTVQGDSDLTACENAELTRLRATAEYLAGRDTGIDYADTAERSVAASARCGDVTTMTAALFEYARSGVETGKRDRIRRALAQIERVGDSSQTASTAAVEYARGYCLFHLGQVQASTAALEAALSNLDERRNPVEESKILTGLAICQHLACETGKALSTGSRALEAARRVGDTSRVSLILGNLSSIHLARGDFAEAISLATESLRLATESLVQPFLLATFTTLAFSYAITGQLRKAEEYFMQGARWVGSGRRWRIRLQYSLEAAEFELIKGNLAIALRHVQAAESLIRDEVFLYESHHAPLRTLLMAHATNKEAALRFIRREVTHTRNGVPFAYLTAAMGLAWLEHEISGTLSAEARDAIADARWQAIPGRRALLAAEGFAVPSP